MSDSGAASGTDGGQGGAQGGQQGGQQGAQFDPGSAFAGLVGTLHPDDKGWVEARGHKDFAGIISAYRGYDRARGVPPDRLLTLPEKMDDPSAMGPVWDRLGRPKDATGYKVPEGIDAERIKPFLGELHQMGAPAPMVEKALGAMVKMAQDAEQARIAEFNTKSDNELAGLRKEWGNAFEQEVARGRRAAKEAGLAKEEIDAIERVLGTAKTMKAFAKLGQQFSEDKLDGGGTGGQFQAMTPDAAKSKIQSMFADKDFMARYTSKSAQIRQGAIAEMERLQRFANPE